LRQQRAPESASEAAKARGILLILMTIVSMTIVTDEMEQAHSKVVRMALVPVN
jgi:hypothetical protein